MAAKWEAAGRTPGTVVVANGDEGDPGSYADRLLMEADPRRVLEGLALACFACGARRAVVLVRSEYPQALARMREAAAEAYADGHFGPRVHSTDTTLDVGVVEGAGSYVAGEETALIASLEGDRGCARPRPPYPTARGLWDEPTVVNNVETLAAVPGSSPEAEKPMPGAERRRRPARNWSVSLSGSPGRGCTRWSWAPRWRASSANWAVG